MNIGRNVSLIIILVATGMILFFILFGFEKQDDDSHQNILLKKHLYSLEYFSIADEAKPILRYKLVRDDSLFSNRVFVGYNLKSNEDESPHIVMRSASSVADEIFADWEEIHIVGAYPKSAVDPEKLKPNMMLKLNTYKDAGKQNESLWILVGALNQGSNYFLTIAKGGDDPPVINKDGFTNAIPYSNEVYLIRNFIVDRSDRSLSTLVEDRWVRFYKDQEVKTLTITDKSDPHNVKVYHLNRKVKQESDGTRTLWDMNSKPIPSQIFYNMESTLFNLKLTPVLGKQSDPRVKVSETPQVIIEAETASKKISSSKFMLTIFLNDENSSLIDVHSSLAGDHVKLKREDWEQMKNILKQIEDIK